MNLNGVYFAYPIDQRGPASLASLFDAVEWMKQSLIGSGLVAWSFDPGDAFNVAHNAKPTRDIAHINQLAAQRADLIVAFLPRGTATIGVPMEIDRAVMNGQHVVIFSDVDSWMLQYGNNNRVHRYHDWDADSLKDAMFMIAAMESPNQSRRKSPMRVIAEDKNLLPTRAYPDDAGLDLIVSEDTEVLPGSFTDIPCGISVELPEWSWGLVTGRSSALRKRGLLIHSGVIDAGYRGPLYSGAWNMTDDTVIVKEGERVAQLIVISNQTQHVEPILSEWLTKTERGEKGFGSSGA